MIKNIKLKAIYINDKKKDGTPFIDKNGNPFKMVSIQNEEGKTASMFCGKFQTKALEVVSAWKVGGEVRVCLEQAGQYLNFSIPTKTDELTERIEKLEKVVFAPKSPAIENKPSVGVNGSITPPNTACGAGNRQELPKNGIPTPPIYPETPIYEEKEPEVRIEDIPFK